MLWNKRLVLPNQDWHHWQQLQAACTVRLCMCVSVTVCLRLCACVFVSVKTRWPDCSSEQRGKAQPCVVRAAPMKYTRSGPQWQPLPSQGLHVCAPPLRPNAATTYVHAPTQTADNAKACLERKNAPPLAVHCSRSSQLLQWSVQILSEVLLSS